MISGILFSCTKEKIDANQSQALQSTTSAKVTNENSVYINTLLIGLVGRFEFNGNLKEQYGKLADGSATARGGAAYTTDRNGNPASALFLNGYYGINLSNVPQQTNGSLTVWAKSLTSQYHYIVAPDLFGAGNALKQSTDTYLGGELIPSFGGMVTSMGLGSANNQWHHLAITYDGTNIYVYTDGVLKATTAFAGSFAQYLAKYHIGFSANESGYWYGCLDDLRFYTRALSPTEVQNLASL